MLTSLGKSASIPRGPEATIATLPTAGIPKLGIEESVEHTQSEQMIGPRASSCFLETLLLLALFI